MGNELWTAAETAAKMEQDSIDFYTGAAARCRNKLGRSMFESLVKDEQRHLDALRRLLKEAAPTLDADSLLPGRGRTFKSQMTTVFSQARKAIGERVPADATDLQALEVAIDLEGQGWRFYDQAARTAPIPAARAVYARLRDEENEHLDFLRNAWQYLDNTGDWFLWEEQGLLDGG